MAAGIHIVWPEGLSSASFAGRPLHVHLRAVAEAAGLSPTDMDGPSVVVDGGFAAVSEASLRRLAATLVEGDGGALLTADGEVVAVARRSAPPEPERWLTEPTGERLTLPADEAIRVADAWAWACAEQVVMQRWLRELALSGVRLIDPRRIYVACSVQVSQGPSCGQMSCSAARR